jgi:hypothetical protein
MKNKTVDWKWNGKSKKGYAIIEAQKNWDGFRSFLQMIGFVLILWGAFQILQGIAIAIIGLFK